MKLVVRVIRRQRSVYVQMGDRCRMFYASDNVQGIGFANEQEPYLLWLRLQGIDLNTASALCCLVARGPLVPLGGARVVVGDWLWNF